MIETALKSWLNKIGEKYSNSEETAKEYDEISKQYCDIIGMTLDFVDEENFDKWDRNRNFDYEDCHEDVLETQIDFVTPRKGTWFLIIENNGRKSARVKVQLY